jgi:hypothetical protein
MRRREFLSALGGATLGGGFPRWSRSLRGPAPSRGWDAYPNLRLRPASPAAGRGRVQRAVRRCFAMHGGMASSTQLYDFALARLLGGATVAWPLAARAQQRRRR